MMRRTHGGARKGAGRPAGKPDTKPRKPRTGGGRHKRQVVLDDETLSIWNSIQGDKSASLRRLMSDAPPKSDEDHEIAASVVGWLNSWEPHTYEGRRVDDNTDEGQALLEQLNAARLRLRDHIAKRAGLTEPGRYFWDDDL